VSDRIKTGEDEKKGASKIGALIRENKGKKKGETENRRPATRRNMVSQVATVLGGGEKRGELNRCSRQWTLHGGRKRRSLRPEEKRKSRNRDA